MKEEEEEGEEERGWRREERSVRVLEEGWRGVIGDQREEEEGKDEEGGERGEEEEEEEAKAEERKSASKVSDSAAVGVDSATFLNSLGRYVSNSPSSPTNFSTTSTALSLVPVQKSGFSSSVRSPNSLSLRSEY